LHKAGPVRFIAEGNGSGVQRKTNNTMKTIKNNKKISRKFSLNIRAKSILYIHTVGTANGYYCFLNSCVC